MKEQVDFGFEIPNHNFQAPENIQASIHQNWMFEA
jgi:hypothetical protein